MWSASVIVRTLAAPAASRHRRRAMRREDRVVLPGDGHREVSASGAMRQLGRMRTEIRRAERDDLPAAAALLAGTLGFGAADAIPAWLMRTTDECGGLTLIAADANAVV